MISHILYLSYNMVFDSLQEEMVRSYVRSAVATNSTYQNTKWVPWRSRRNGAQGHPPVSTWQAGKSTSYKRFSQL